MEDKLFIAARRAVLEGIPKNTLNSRLRRITNITGLPRLDFELLKQWKKLVTYDIEEHDRSIRKPKKYSGYVKSPSSVGSKRSTQAHPEPGIFQWSSVVEIDYFRALTVGEFIGASLVIVLPDDEPK
jgi:hypothetical protein